MKNIIPFDIKYRKQIESGLFRVVTIDGDPVRIICWDAETTEDEPIVAIVNKCVETYSLDGIYYDQISQSGMNLRIQIPLNMNNYNEFESVLLNLCKNFKNLNGDLEKEIEFIKMGAKKLYNKINEYK